MDSATRAPASTISLLVRAAAAWALTAIATAGAAPQAAQDEPAFEQGSLVDVSDLSAVQVENLALLGKVWGFLKYHHPSITAGGVQWDFELFRVLPEMLDAQDRRTACEVLSSWVEFLGVPERPRRPAKPVDPDDAHLMPELDWIADREALGKALSESLQQIHERRHAGGPQHYVSQAPGIGNPVFDNELGYEHLQRVDAGYRLLALFRFWNVIEYWFPYRDVIGEDWERVLVEFVPRLVRAEAREDYALEMMALIARVHDAHANLWSSLDVRPPRGDLQLPWVVRFVEERALVTDRWPRRGGGGEPSPDPDGLRVGDEILALDGLRVADWVETLEPYYAASNRPRRLWDIGMALGQGAGAEARLEVERDGSVLELTAARVPRVELDPGAGRARDRSGDTFQRLSDQVAYLKLSSVDASRASQYIESAAGTKGLIIDIRNYPSSFVVFELGGRLVRSATPFARFTSGSLSNPGAFVWTRPLSLAPLQPRYEGRVVVLVDETTQSQAEYTAMALRAAPGALVVGSTTAGADGNVSRLQLPGGLGTMISGIGVFYPDKTPTQRVGIVPDIEVRPTVEGVRAGRDEVLEAGLRQVLGSDAQEAQIREIARPR